MTYEVRNGVLVIGRLMLTNIYDPREYRPAFEVVHSMQKNYFDVTGQRLQD